MNGYQGREFVTRTLYALIGVAIIGLGAAVLKVGGIGVDPYTALNTGIAAQIGWTLGTYQLLSNFVLFIPMLIWGRKYLGVGTVINFVLTGFFIDLFAGLLQPVVPSDPGLLVQTIFFVVGILVFALGASAYMCAGLGTAPYDAIAPMIVDKTGWEYQRVRVVQDVIILLLAVLARGPVGFGTIVTAFFNGPLIQWYSIRVHQPLLKKLTGNENADIDAVKPSEERA